MKMKQLISELNSECILTKLEKKEITELLQRGEKFEQMWKKLEDTLCFNNPEYIDKVYQIMDDVDKWREK